MSYRKRKRLAGAVVFIGNGMLLTAAGLWADIPLLVYGGITVMITYIAVSLFLSNP